MKQYIQKIIKPTVLYLMWKGPKNRRYKVGDLYEDKFTYDTDSTEFSQAIEEGFKGFPAFSLEQKTHKNPLPVFMRRCPPKSRSDYATYLRAFGLDPQKQDGLDDFTLLGYTGAHVPENRFNLANPFVGVSSPFDFVMQVAGAHHEFLKKNPAIKPNTLIESTLKAEAEPENEFDNKAIKLLLESGETLGYVPRGLNETFHKWLGENEVLDIKISRTNGMPDHPYVYAYIKVGKF